MTLNINHVRGGACRPPEPLTRVELDALRIIAEWIAINGEAPSQRELSTELDSTSSSYANKLVKILARKRWITRNRYKSRDITVLHAPTFPPGIDVDLAALGLDQPSKDLAGAALS